MSNQKPFIDPSLFTKPPSSFNKNTSSNWNNFKVPSSPNKNNASSSKISARNYSQETLTNYSTPPPKCYPPSPEPQKNYSQSTTRSPVNLEMNYHQTTPPPNAVRNYKNEPPSSPDKNYKGLVFNPVSLVQPFKPSVPPPQINKTVQSSQYDIKPIPAAQVHSLSAAAGFDAAKANCHLQMLIGLQQLSHFSNSLLTHPIGSIQPPPPNYPPPQQPPLPPGAPPDVSPPPPPPLHLSSPNMCNLAQRNSSPGPIHLQNHHHMGNYHTRLAHPFSGYNQNFNKQMHYNLKRKYEFLGNNDIQKKNSKKKKKPLSQVVPQRRDWSMEEARKALEVEKECNKRSKRQGLIIKFPDLELNRDIVTSFHTSIESVHFQQPSTPRYCFVTLSGSADPETVIKQLNQIPFGLGYLSAEFKKEREDEQNIKPTDIDPLTLYVGNLAQEITKEDMIKTFPHQKRIDIGYAKKMKYTRYAFVSFHTVNDAIDAFMKTHSSQMYSKSLIVRFRRLHGTVGMPGETKLHSNSCITPEIDNNLDDTGRESNPWDIDVSHWENDHYLDVKYMDSHISEDEYDEDLTKNIVPLSPSNFQTRLSSSDHSFSSIRPGRVTVKEEKNDEFEEVIEHPVNNYEYREQFMRSESSKQDFQTVLGNIKQEDVKREEIKSENYQPVTTRFRVIPQTIRPSSSSTIANNFPENVTVKNERYYNKNNTQSGSSNIQNQQTSFNLENSSTDTGNSIDDSSNSQKEISLSCENISSEIRIISNDWNPDNLNTSNSIVPAPIIIKKETDNIKEETMDSGVANDQILSDGASVDNLISLNGSNGDVECDRSENESVQLSDDGDNFSWMNMDPSCPAQDIKTELDEVDGDDDTSSDDELTIDNILKKTREGSSKKGR